MSNEIDFANTTDAAKSALSSGTFPPLPVIDSSDWRPPQQTAPVKQGTMPDRLKIFANSDKHEWTEYMLDTPHPNADAIAVMNYWDGQGAAQYTLTGRSYWVLVPGTYTQVTPGGGFQKEYTSTVGIATTDSQTLSSELGVDGSGLSAKVSVAFTHSVTTSSASSVTTTYSVGAPAAGFTRVWMLWQLCDELSALDGNGTLIANPTRHADVNWSEHAAGGGAFVNYANVQQIFQSDFFVPIQRDFPNS